MSIQPRPATPKSVHETVMLYLRTFHGSDENEPVTLTLTYDELEVLEDMTGWYVNDLPEKRERLASLAMQGLLTNAPLIDLYNTRNDPSAMAVYARDAVKCADALLAALANDQKETPK